MHNFDWYKSILIQINLGSNFLIALFSDCSIITIYYAYTNSFTNSLILKKDQIGYFTYNNQSRPTHLDNQDRGHIYVPLECIDRCYIATAQADMDDVLGMKKTH